MTKSNRDVFSNQGDIILRLNIQSVQISNPSMISSMSTLSASLRKTEWVMLMKKSSRGFFQQSMVWTLRVMIRSGQFPNSSEISSMSTLTARFRKSRSKLNELLWWQSNRGFFSNQGNVTLRLMLRSGKFSKSFEISSISTLSASLRNIRSKLKELWWWKAFSHCKSMGPVGCQRNQSFHWISMESLCHRCPTRGML